MSLVDPNNLNYTVHVPYNESVPTGGDSLTQDLNVHYEVSCNAPPHWRTKSIANGMNLVGRYRLDDRSHCARVAHDSWCWVRLQMEDTRVWQFGVLTCL